MQLDRQVTGDELRRQLGGMATALRACPARVLAEQVLAADKDVDEVVAACEHAGLPGGLPAGGPSGP